MPFSALSVEWNDDFVDPSSHMQSHPPSGMRCSGSHASMAETSAPSHAPFARVKPLMQQSASPCQYGPSLYSHREFSASFSAVPANATGSVPHPRRMFKAQVVAVYG